MIINHYDKQHQVLDIGGMQHLNNTPNMNLRITSITNPHQNNINTNNTNMNTNANLMISSSMPSQNNGLKINNVKFQPLNRSMTNKSDSPFTPSSSSSPTLSSLPNLNMSYKQSANPNPSPNCNNNSHSDHDTLKQMDKPKRGRKKIDRTSYLNAKGTYIFVKSNRIFDRLEISMQW